MARVLGVYVVARLASLVGFGIALRHDPSGGWSRVFGMWDARNYLSIAEHGYPHQVPTVGGAISFDAAFLPGFPLAMRGVHELTGAGYLLAGVLLSLGGGAAASLLLLRLGDRWVTPEESFRCAVLFAAWPGSVVFSVAYAEGLLLFFTMACLLALEQRRWWLAAAAGALATATRAIAVALLVPAVWAAIVAWRERREHRSVVAPLGVLSGLGAVLAYQWWLTGEPRAWFIAEHRGWDQKIDFGARFITPFLHPGTLRHLDVAARFGLLIVVIVGVVMLWRMAIAPLALAYTLGVAIQFVLSSAVGPRPRFILTAFPLLFVPARYLRGKTFVGTTILSLLLLSVLAALYAVPDVLIP